MSRTELEKRWQREEFLLLERSPEVFDRLVGVLAGESQEAGDQAELIRLLDQGLAQAPTAESRVRAAQAIWSRLEEKAEGELAVQARELMAGLSTDPWAIVYLKKVFKVLAAKQGWKEFLKSSYLED